MLSFYFPFPRKMPVAVPSLSVFLSYRLLICKNIAEKMGQEGLRVSQMLKDDFDLSWCKDVLTFAIVGEFELLY